MCACLMAVCVEFMCEHSTENMFLLIHDFVLTICLTEKLI